MDMGEAVRSCIGNYATFAGRAPRSEYWFFILFEVLLLSAAMVVLVIVGAVASKGGAGVAMGLMVLLLAGVVLGLFLPRLAVTVRRLHDTNHSGWWLLLVFVPFGGIVLLVWSLSRGTHGMNDYGHDPLGGSYAEVFG